MHTITNFFTCYLREHKRKHEKKTKKQTSFLFKQGTKCEHARRHNRHSLIDKENDP